MKKFNIIAKYCALFILALSFNACEKYFGDVNIDPNAAVIAPPSTLLPTIEARIAYTYWGDFSRYASIYTQHLKGVDRQFAGYQGYNFIPDDFSSAWSNCYEGTLMDIQRLKLASDEGGNEAYGGIARALEAYTILMIADYWGDAPYSDAFKGTDQLQPKYDSQEQLYATAATLLTDARAKLTTNAGLTKPGSYDLIYGGNVGSWIKFCNVLSARMYLHLGKKDAANYTKALAELNKGGFADASESMAFQFTSEETASAPWYQYIGQREGDVSNGDGYTALLKKYSDPRSAATAYGAPFDGANPLFIPDQKTTLLGYTEMKFIEAELLQRTGGDAAKTKAALEAGIQASMAEAQVADAAAITAYIAQPAVSTANLEGIMTQKYLALYLNAEVLNDLRRTGIPALTPNAGTELPRRFLHPQGEIDLNSNTPKGFTIYSKVGWDK